MILKTDLKKKSLIDEEGKKVNLVPGTPIFKLVSEFTQDKKEDMQGEHMRVTADQETWELFVKLFLQYTVQTNVWKTQCGRAKISQFVTVWDEAFAIVAVESNMKLWLHQAAGLDKAEEKGMELYVVRGKKKRGAKVRIGWTMEGKKRYNVICDELEVIRNNAESVKKEEIFMKKYAGDVGDSASNSDTESDDAWEREQREIEEFEPRGGFN